MDQVVVLIFVIVIYEIFEMILTPRSPVAVQLHIGLVILTAQLERCLSRLYALLAHKVPLCDLLLDLLFAFRLVLFAHYHTFVRRVIQ